MQKVAGAEADAGGARPGRDGPRALRAARRGGPHRLHAGECALLFWRRFCAKNKLDQISEIT